MTLASRVRNFFDTLFPSHIVLQLRADLEDARRERDYFRDKADRLELRLIPPPVVRGIRSPEDMKPVGRKNWKQVQADHAKELRKQEEAEAQAKAVQGAN